MMLYIATKSFKHILNNYKVIDRVGTTAKLKITMGHNSTKKEGGVMILVPCISTDDALYLYHVL